MTELARINAEIASAEEYRGPDAIYALLGWADWMIEREILKEEEMGYDIPADHHGSLPRTLEEFSELQQKYRTTRPLALQEIIELSVSRANRWHNGSMDEWSPLEWAGAMCGEAGECANAAKKLKRLEDGITSINANDPDSETVRHFDDVETAKKVVGKEVADTILYAVLVAARVGVDLPQVLREVFNKKSEEYGFPERL